LKRLIRKNMVI